MGWLGSYFCNSCIFQFVFVIRDALLMLLIVLIVSSSTEVPIENIESNEATDCAELPNEETSQFQKQPSFFVDSATIERMVKF